MKLHLTSDLHVDFGDHTLPGGADLLIVAGDFCEARTFVGNHDGRARLLQGIVKRFAKEEFAKYPNVIFVPGNHEYYGRTLDEAEELLMKHLPSNVILLQNRSINIGGVDFFGATMWTDMNKGDPQTEMIVRMDLNDFKAIDDFSVALWKYEHASHLTGLRNFLSLKGNNRVVVISHHAPSFMSVPIQFKTLYHQNGGFASDLSELILNNPQISHWFHGHMHDPSDYSIGETRVLCHPRGYCGYDNQAYVYQPLEIVL